jgi:hypothetical protein
MLRAWARESRLLNLWYIAGMGWINEATRRGFWSAVRWFALTLVTSVGCGYCAGVAKLRWTSAADWSAAAFVCALMILAVAQSRRAVKQIIADRTEAGVRTSSAVSHPLGAPFTIAGNGFVVGGCLIALVKNLYGIQSFLLMVSLFVVAVTVFRSLRILAEICRWPVMERSGLLFTETKD